VQEIVLAPKGNGNEQITLWISKTSHPIYIKVENNGRPVSEIHVKNVRKQKEINDQVFRFNKSLYPNAEIIDLR
jgi:outer membrane lipoprotein-sorting protein